MRRCDCPDDAQINIGTWGNPYTRLCNCCGKTWQEDPPEIDPWLMPGHVCTCDKEPNGISEDAAEEELRSRQQ